MSTTLRAKDIAYTRHAALRGIAWLKESWTMFRAQPRAWLLFLGGYMAIQLLVGTIAFQLGPIGTFAALLMRPVLSVAFLAAAWSQERGESVHLRHLLSGFRSNVKYLLAVGALFPTALIVAIFVSGVVDGGLLWTAVVERREQALDIEQRQAVARAMLFVTLCLIPVFLATWFASALVVFQDVSPVRAFGASLNATLGNWRPMLVYGMLVFGLAAVLPSILSAVVAAMLGVPPSDNAVWLVLLPYVLPVATVLQIADYVSYRDVFHADEKPTRGMPQPGRSNDDQGQADG